ncbi:interleukin-6-like [Nematolebias whitei]|uniref:interleukin-6-like n=1 Tax=Nematolebias whitei TaxID=451745 RepID=UPI00189C3DBD|nr:interleukin-6-like [Nematolebias whitei]
MSSKLTLRMLLAAVTLAALQLCASGAPLEEPTGGETSGEEGEETPDLMGTLNIFNIWEQVIAPTKRHEKEFEEEFQGNVDYISLDNKRPSFPVKCPDSNFTKEACLQRLAEGLLNYTVLLKHVEKEYPNCSMLAEIEASVPLLITQIKAKMRKSERVKALTSSQKEQLLKELDNPDTYARKMTAHSVLSSLRFFLIDGKRSIRRWETPKRQAANTGSTN